jgi:translation initiation factor IF-2
MVKTKKEKIKVKKELKPKKAVTKIIKTKTASAVKVKKISLIKVKKIEKVVTPKRKPVKIKEKIYPQASTLIEKPVIPVAPVEIHKPSSEKETEKEPHVTKKEIPSKPKAVEVKPVIETKPVIPAAIRLQELELDFPITVKDLSIRLQEKPSNLIKKLMDMRIMVGINQTLEEAVVITLCEKYSFSIRKAPGKEELALSIHQKEDQPKDLVFRSPIVTFMGHVDHGKTSLLDAIRKTKVAESEHGGITQHIGAYRVNLAHGEITFLDTPGHEAFTAMRARGASITDIVVLVVAADDGIMPQTNEAIDHARAAGVPIIVAINKIDKPQANLDRVKKQLGDADLKAEDWGGKTITVGVSAKTGEGIDTLLEMLLLEAQMLELKANPKRLASGVVIEAKMAKGRGPVTTLLIKNGTLHLNENIIVGKFYGKIRAMFNDRGNSVTSAGPGFPVEILGISGIPEAGEQFFVIEEEKQAKELAQLRLEQERQQQVKAVKRINLEDLHAQIKEGKIKELKIIIKADVQGSLEAIKDTLNKLNVSEIKLDIIHTGVGNINSSDVILAVASNALVLGFNVVADERAKEISLKEGIDIKIYNIIYELANDIKAAVEGMLEPKLKKVPLGKIEIRKVLKLTRAGTVAGCYVAKGKITRSAFVDLVRNGQLVFEGKISSLKRRRYN